MQAGDHLDDGRQAGDRQGGQRCRRQREDEATDHVGQRRKGQLPFEQTARAADDGRTGTGGFFQQQRAQASFADARFAFQDDQVATVLEGVFQRSTQHGDFLFAADKVVEDRRVGDGQQRPLGQHVGRRVARPGLGLGTRTGIRHRFDFTVEDLLVDLLGQRAGVGPQLFGEQPAAAFIAEQRACAVARGGLIAHERLVGGFAHRVARQDLAASGDGRAKILGISAQRGEFELRVDV